jgi:hypothetical protein
MNAHRLGAVRHETKCAQVEPLELGIVDLLDTQLEGEVGRSHRLGFGGGGNGPLGGNRSFGRDPDDRSSLFQRGQDASDHVGYDDATTGALA